jgi:DNA helicase-2/ATP-dependent DNA helicase PcrA
MKPFEAAYKSLNAEQKQAVDTIDGPLLVIAGPGTGKTQLLSARVANILKKTDTPAQNILCLTFTENGANNMRERLTRFIGRDAYDVTISTYHAFGSDLISRYPEYFLGARLENSVDDLGKRQILLDIIDDLGYKDPLKQTRHHIGDLMSTISEVKRALLDSSRLREVAAQNLAFITTASTSVSRIFEGVARMPGTFKKAEPYYEEILAECRKLAAKTDQPDRISLLSGLFVEELESALETAREQESSKPLTKWKSKWLAKDESNRFVIAGELENHRIESLAYVLEAYETVLAAQGLYDFDDMILRSIKALETHADLRYTLQERYLYILLDEFQDTNAAQLKLINLLTDNPVNEGRPNVLAVGDDDQAIYAFQGAEYSNMRDFYEMYRDTKVINLTKNYRSHEDIIKAASNVAEQIEGRLYKFFEGATKELTAANGKIGTSDLERREFQSVITERAWVASKIRSLIDSGVSPSAIAVLAPKHKQLEPLVAYLNHAGVAVKYEKRENILETDSVRQILTMCKLLMAVADGNRPASSVLWTQVLSSEFWEIETTEIWKLSWNVHDDKDLTWNQAVMDSTVPNIARAAKVILETAVRAQTDSVETILDYLMGLSPLPSGIISPFKEFYSSSEHLTAHPQQFYEAMSHLTVLRTRLKEFQHRSDKALLLPDLLRYVALYEEVEQPMIDTSPYSQSAEAVQLMTVYKAKGLEFEHVFIIEGTDDVWGSVSRGNSNKLTLPPNLQPIRHAGATDDERLRALFVAMTRARHGLYITSASGTFSGKSTPRLKYLDEQEQPDGTFAAMVLPEQHRKVIATDTSAPEALLLELDWHTRHHDQAGISDLRSLLADRLESYQISPSHMTSFIDISYGGPREVFYDAVLNFPRASSVESQYGIAVHETLQWYQLRLSELGYNPTIEETLDYFASRMRIKNFNESDLKARLERGSESLSEYLTARGKYFKPEDIAEKGFRTENVFVGSGINRSDAAHLTGRIDKLEIDQQHKTITIVDYKTGKSFDTWKHEIKLHKYALQLYAYKILVEGSRSFKGYKVTAGRLEFVEPDDAGRIHALELAFTDGETERVKLLFLAVWRHIQELNFPDTRLYPATIKRVEQFEQELIDGEI